MLNLLKSLTTQWPIRSLLLCLLPWLLCCFSLCAKDTAPATAISLNGYLSKEEFSKAASLMKKAEPRSTIILEINSNSGDLNAAMDFAKILYIAKQENEVIIITYINDKALGPAALLPFAADELYVSHFVSWGDIPLGSEGAIPTNILRNQVISLISPRLPQAELLSQISAAMSDAAAPLPQAIPSAANKGGPLVLNQQQLLQLKLVQGVLSPEDFRRQRKLPEEPLQQADAMLSASLSKNKDLLNQLQEHIKYNVAGVNSIGHILIEDHTNSISQATWLYVKNALDYYKEKKPAFVILELNTPGGEVFAAQKISDALKDFDTQYGIPVVCYINNWAISAGAMLAYSCRFIVTAKDGSMGAAEPIILGEGEMKTASEKVNSALRADFANRASFFGRNPNIAEAMVDKDIILVLRHNQIIKLDSDTQVRTTGPNPDVVISPKGKLLTLNAEQMIDYDVADMLLLPEKLELITPSERDTGKWPASKMLLFHAPFFDKIPEATVDSFQMDWKMRFFALLATPLVSSMLLLGVMLGFYVEITTPGFGVAGAIGVISLLLLLLSSFSLEIANWLEIILLLTGLAIILIDFFLLPTFGLLGFAGLMFFLVGLIGALLPGLGSIEYEFDTKTFNAAGQLMIERATWLFGTLVVGTGLIILLARYITPTIAAYSKLVLAGHEQDSSQGYIAVDDPSKLPPSGSVGEVLATLRPTGKVIIAGKIYDAISHGEFIDKGMKVSVTNVESNLLVVTAELEKTS